MGKNRARKIKRERRGRRMENEEDKNEKDAQRKL